MSTIQEKVCAYEIVIDSVMLISLTTSLELLSGKISVPEIIWK